jgi:uncharacterized membrane protein YgcG
MRNEDHMTRGERELEALLAAVAGLRLGEGRRTAMRERVLERVLADELAVPAPAGRVGAGRRGSTRSLATRLVAVGTAVSVFGGGAVAYASEGAMPRDALYPVKRAMQAAALAAAPTASLKVGVAIRMAGDRLAEATDVAATDPELAADLAGEAQEMLYEAAAGAEGMSAEARDEVVARLTAIGVRQREHLMQIAARLPDAAQAGIMRAIARAGGEARARAIEVHLGWAERRVAARARARAAAHAGGASRGAGQDRAPGAGQGQGQDQDTPGASSGKGKPSDTERGRSDAGDESQGQDQGSGGGQSGGGSQGGSSGGGGGGAKGGGSSGGKP